MLRTVSTYVSRALLRPGLFVYSLEAGLVRTGYATPADCYADPAVIASLRAGMNDGVTSEAHGELGARVGVGTAGVSLGLGRAGLLSVSAGARLTSKSGQRGGAEVALGYERIGRPVGMALRYVRQTADWYDLASDYGAVTRTHTLSGTLGFDLGRLGNVGLIVINQGRGRVARPSTGVPSRSSYPRPRWSPQPNRFA